MDDHFHIQCHRFGQYKASGDPNCLRAVSQSYQLSAQNIMDVLFWQRKDDSCGIPEICSGSPCMGEELAVKQHQASSLCAVLSR